MPSRVVVVPETTHGCSVAFASCLMAARTLVVQSPPHKQCERTHTQSQVQRKLTRVARERDIMINQQHLSSSNSEMPNHVSTRDDEATSRGFQCCRRLPVASEACHCHVRARDGSKRVRFDVRCSFSHNAVKRGSSVNSLLRPSLFLLFPSLASVASRALVSSCLSSLVPSPIPK
jgi:hypothetical protein